MQSLTSTNLANELLNAIVDASPLAIISRDVDGKIEVWNKAAESIYGFTAKEAVGSKLFLDIGQHFDPEFPDIFHRVMRGEELRGLELRRHRKDNRLVNSLVTMAPLRTFDGSIQGSLLLSADVSAEKALRQSEARFRRIFEGSPLGIMLTTRGGEILHVNPALCKMVGYQADELIGQRIDIITHPEDRGKHALADGDETASGWRNAEMRFVAKSGGIIRVRIYVEPFEPLGDDAAQLLNIVIVEDVTARKEAEEGRDRAEERRDRAEEKLEQSQKMEAIGQLTGGIAHDFNNLLLAISLSLDALEREPDPTSAPGLIAEAKNATEHARILTSQLLAFGRRQALNPTDFDVNDSIFETTQLLRRSVQADITITAQPKLDSWHVHVDRNQLGTALLNLAINARDAMPAGGCLRIECENVCLDSEYATQNPDVETGDYVMIAVSDTGVGMSKENAERAFEPFYTTKSLGQGTGLGLSQVYGFIKQSGGHVRIYSELGRGTTMKLYLPRSHAHAAVELPKETKVAAQRGGGTILVVEDTGVVRKAVKRLLDGLGYRVIDVGTAGEAIAVLDSPGHIDVLFTDLMLPGGTGGEELAATAQRLRPGIKTLFTSGYTQGALQQVLGVSTKVPLITKPYAATSLAAKLHEVLGSLDPQLTHDDMPRLL